ncbi:nitroreductase [Microlunatus panaciterrae]|uniref:Nitroreductase n=1 Tax=Microlunatus panaciterrae TaxID=400768 RepID=A0ABS2RGK5_9ACTN|nr:nitroreductase [Microlunatus panaciterrae]
MSIHTDYLSELSDFEAEFADQLALGTDAQNLLFRDARTPNTFTDEPVSEEQIQAIFELAKWGPTAMNIQPLRIVLVRSPEAREQLVAAMADGNKDKTRSAPLVAILAADTDFHEELGKVFPHNPAAKERFAADEASREKMSRMNAALQIGYFIVAVRAAGFAAGPMGGFDATAVEKQFYPDGKHRAMLVVNIGKPGENAFRDRLPRLDYDEVVSTV